MMLLDLGSPRCSGSETFRMICRSPPSSRSELGRLTFTGIVLLVVSIVAIFGTAKS